jgi:hypothetical protein
MKYIIKILLLLFLIIIASYNSSAQELRIDLNKIVNKLKELKTNKEVLVSLKKTLSDTEKRYGMFSMEFYEVGCIFDKTYLIINKNIFSTDSTTQKEYFKIAKNNYQVAKSVYGISSIQFAESYSKYLSSIQLLNYQKFVNWNFDTLKH